jgi:hypothetical protein
MLHEKVRSGCQEGLSTRTSKYPDWNCSFCQESAGMLLLSSVCSYLIMLC